jgi:hypothetical protein
MSNRRVRRWAQLFALVSATTALLIFSSSGTSQAEVPPITDYASYPPALPAGCADGESALEGVQFSSNGASSPDLRTLALTPGQTFTMTWTGFSEGCAGVGVGLSSKMATLPIFSADTEYWLYDYVYCGPEAGATPCAPGAGSLTLAVPPAAQVPCYQLDAHLGPPLGQVGPTTGYYSGLNGSHSMLISAQNGGTGDCSSLPPCATNPAIPDGAFLCQAQSSTTTTTSTAPTPSTPPPAPTPTTAPPVATSQTACAAGQIVDAATGQCVAAPSGCAPGQTLDATSGQCVSVLGSSGAALPVTGRDSGALAATGALLLLSGLCLVYAYRRAEGAPPARR